MKTLKVFFVAWFIIGSINVNLIADPIDITYNTDGLIQVGDDYDHVDVYGDTTTVNMTGGEVTLLWTYDQSTTNIFDGLVCYAQTNDQSIINISGGVIHEPRAWFDGTINVTGGECWNVEVGGGTFNISGGQITGSGIYAPTYGSVINIYGYGFAFEDINDGQLTGFWQDTTPFLINFYHPGFASTVNSYDSVVLHEVTPIPLPGAVLLVSIGLSFSGWWLRRSKKS